MTAAPAPGVSVVLATHNRADRLARALAALAGQDHGGSWELIVVDDASADRTPEVLAGLASDPRIRVIRRDEAGGPAGARNTGWREASAPLVAFTDDDCEPTPGWLAAIAAAAAENPGAFIQGPTAPNPAEAGRLGPFSRTIDVAGLGPWFPTCNVAYPRELLERLGGFDESLPRGEDTDLAWRAQESGAHPVWAAGALVHHAVMELGAVPKLRLAAKWEPAVRNFKRHPGLRRHIPLGLFWKRSHGLFLLALAGAMLARRFPPALCLALPYLRDVRRRMASEQAPVPLAGYYALHDAVEVGIAARGSARYRTLIL